jgi:DNA processing protein
MNQPVPSPRPSGLTREEGIARIRLIRSPNVGPVTYHHLLARLGSARAALDALPELSARGRTKGARGAYQAFAQEAAEAEMLTVRSAGARYVFHDSADYPPLLRMVEGAPPILIIRGQMAMATRNPVALVGARNASAGAAKIARDLAIGLANHGCAVVSGLARGVDAAAHDGALSAIGGAGTVAVIAGGIDVTYPPEHADLQARIAEHGLIISEMPPGTEPTNRHFPARNRIIAALSLGTVVVEAALKSGSLITARLAGDYGREVMAVPGSPLDPRSYGGNVMIREGAMLVQRVEDILELITSFDGVPRSHFREDGADPFEIEDEAFLEAIGAGDDPEPANEVDVAVDTSQALSGRIEDLLGVAPVSVGELIRQSGGDTAAVQAVLIDMELAGVIIRHAGGRVSRAVS